MDIDQEWMQFKLSRESAKYIPLRLTSEERKKLSVIQGALDVSEYTDNVDVSNSNYYVSNKFDKHETILEEIEDLCQLTVGLGLANDYGSRFQKSVASSSLVENQTYVASCFEIARRYKIMNPDKMRTTYGKLVFALMDCQRPGIKREMEGVELVYQVKTVHSFLENADMLAMLEDPILSEAACMTGSAEEMRETRRSGLNGLIEKYADKNSPAESEDSMDVVVVTAEEIHLLVDSIIDSFDFLKANLKPVVDLIAYLRENFDPSAALKSSLDSLEIKNGRNGSCLTHAHATQFNFVLQSLILWKNILRHFFKAWILAEEDLLSSGNGYRLCNTGQGMQRCQAAPKVSAFMQDILSMTKAEIRRLSSSYTDLEEKTAMKYQREWVGLSVVHLGDRDVPNALVFIDKYTQISRMLNPLVKVLERIEDDFEKNAHLRKYVQDEFGGQEALKKRVLGDYFRHGFDGSGDDGGSCIDGRLTSSWNWCSKIDKKKYYPVFLLAGFLGFDGDFRE